MSTANLHPAKTRPIIRCLSEVAAARPDGPALACAHETLSHAALQARSNAIAARLIEAGIMPGSLVGICLHRSCAQVAAMLGVWKAGAACLPVDPTWPVERLRFLIAEANCAALLARSGQLSEALSDTVPIVIDVDATAAAPAGEVPLDDSRADELAYVIYTSGSTGVPKGVEVGHCNLGHLIDWHNAAFAVTPDTRAASLASIGFDANLWDVWPYLAAGASVSIVPDLVRSSAPALAEWLVEQSIEIAFAPTLLAEQLITMAWPPGTRLRTLLTGADSLVARPPADLPFTLVNNYGPTECTVVATSGPVAAREFAHGRPSIGRPIANTQVYLLDSQGRPVANGVSGEIFIGGAGVALGYRGRPDLTSERFVPDPSSSDPAARLYRTGDLASRDASGELFFHGRIDEQVKIRGHRVEPEEVAEALRRHPDVAAVAVTGSPSHDGVMSLTAYLVPSRPALDAESVCSHLATLLPDYMIPSTLVRLDALPVTSNGKLDRAALPAPSTANQLVQSAFEAPTNALERRLAEILTDVMKLDTVGLDDNFFLLGGHSLLGTQIVLRAGDAFGINLTLRDLFDAPTVRRLAIVVEQRIVEAVSIMSDEQVFRLSAA
ncbi:MAG: non-ribosomal peptide synthetase [Pseudomonadota bacterium]|nr:non-ribosomal peptide synthetase [Pseudomonadota bacterium]